MNNKVKNSNSFEGALDTIIKDCGLEGASAVFYENKKIFSDSSGFIDEKKQNKYTNDTLIRIGCAVKVFSATQVMLLKDDGFLELDVPIVNYIPELNSLNHPYFNIITTRQLLTHQSGFVANIFDNDKKITTNNCISVLSKKDADEIFAYSPGEYCSYSSFGYIVLALLIEKISGESWINNLNTKIFKPLNINCHQLSDNEKKYAPTGTCTREGFDGPYKYYQADEFLPAEGGILALTAMDLMKFSLMHLNEGLTHTGNKLISSQSVAEMQEYLGLPSGPWDGLNGLGFGWLAYEDGSYGFSGDGIRNHVLIRIHPKKQIALTVVANYHSAGILFGLLWDAFDNKPINNQPIDYKKDITFTHPDISKYAPGKYFDGVREYNVSFEGNNGMIEAKGLHSTLVSNSISSKLELVSNNRYIAPDLGHFCNLWFLDLSKQGEIDYLWNGVTLYKKTI